MHLLKIAAGTIFNILGVLVLYKGIRICRYKGIGEGFVDIIAGLGFILIGLLIWTGYIS
jgi:putative Ca2+/H+ antiporter (TMEM165/GDT1 family)